MRIWMLLLGLAWAAFAQARQPSCLLQGRVFDRQTGNSLPHATVWLPQEAKGWATDSTGYFHLHVPCGAPVQLEVRYVGYRSASLSLLPGGEVQAVYLSEEDGVLEEVQVTASAPAVAIQSLAAHALEARQLEVRQALGLAQALEGISGVSTLRTGNQVAKPMIHGLHSNRVLVLNNGIRQEGQQWGADHAPEIDAFAAARLSVVKGAATVRYGAEALGGVVLLSPAELPDRPGLGGSLHATAIDNGRLGALNAQLEGGSRRWRGFGWRVQASAKRGGDMRTPDYWLTNTGIREHGFSGNMGWKGARAGSEFYYSYYRNTTGILKATSVLGTLDDLALAIGAPTPALTQPYFDNAIGLPRQEVSHHLAKWQGYWNLGAGRLHWQYGWQRNHRQEFDRRLGAERSTKPVIDLQLQAHTLDLWLEQGGSGARQRQAGLQLAYKDNNNLPGTGRIPLIPNHNSWEAGLFWVEKASLGRWDLEAGLRYDAKYFSVRGRDFKNRLFSQRQYLQNLTAMLGATWHSGPYASWQFHVGSAWRAPNPAELYSFGKKQGVGAIEYGLLLNDRLEVQDWAESDIRNEQGIKAVATYQYRKGPWEAEASLFGNWISNYLFLAPKGVTVGVAGPYPYYRYEQTDAFFKGLDAQTVWRPHPRWQAEGQIALLWAKDVRQRDWLPFIPANTGQLRLRHNFPNGRRWKDAHLGASVRYTAKPSQAPRRVVTVEEFTAALLEGIDLLEEDPTRFDFMPRPDGYCLFGASAGAERPIGNALLRATLQADNLLNTSYRNYVNRLRYFATETGRTIILSLKYIF